MRQRENLLDVFGLLYKKRKLILTITGVSALAAVVLALVLPVYYAGSTTFLAASPDQANPTVLYNDAEAKVYGTGNDIERIIGIANSEELFSFLLDSFDLYSVYDVDPTKPKARTLVREKFNSLYEVTRTKYDAIELRVEDQDKLICAAMANAARDRIEQLLRGLNAKSLNRLQATYSKSISGKTQSLQLAAKKLDSLQQVYGILDVEAQAESLSGLLGALDRQLVKDSTMLMSYRRSRRRGAADSVAVIATRLEADRQQRIQLKAELANFTRGSSLVGALSKEVEYLTAQLTFDRERLRQIQSINDDNATVLYILDEAREPDTKSRPVRSLIVLGITFMAFVLAALGVIVADTYNSFDWAPYFKD